MIPCTKYMPVPVRSRTRPLYASVRIPVCATEAGCGVWRDAAAAAAASMSRWRKRGEYGCVCVCVCVCWLGFDVYVISLWRIELRMYVCIHAHVREVHACFCVEVCLFGYIHNESVESKLSL
jgi:hypothetical protein